MTTTLAEVDRLEAQHRALSALAGISAALRSVVLPQGVALRALDTASGDVSVQVLYLDTCDVEEDLLWVLVERAIADAGIRGEWGASGPMGGPWEEGRSRILAGSFAMFTPAAAAPPTRSPKTCLNCRRRTAWTERQCLSDCREWSAWVRA